MNNQCARVLNYIDEHGSITQLEAINEIAVLRLASRISDLRKNGVGITREMVKVKNRYGEDCTVARYRKTAAPV